MAKQKKVNTHKVRTEKEGEEWIKNKAKSLVKCMKFGHLRLKMVYKPDIKDIDEGSMEAMFAIRTSPKYHSATILITKSAMDLCKKNLIELDKDLIDGLVHELAHIHTEILVATAHSRYATEKELADNCEELTEIMAGYVRDYLVVTTDIYK